MRVAFDTITRDIVSADEVAKNNIDEPFRYECLCCGEEVHIAAAKSRKMVPHFRHLRGNSDKDCELYLGGLLQTGSGIESAVAVAQKRARSHAEILYDIEQQVFYFSISFSEEKLTELQEDECELEISTGSNNPMKPVLINKFNFAPDSPVRFPLRLTSNSCHITIRSRKKVGSIITSYYAILKSIEFPTFFKLQTKVSDHQIAKRHTDGIIYTDTRYYLIAAKKSYIEKLYHYFPHVSVGDITEILALGSTVFGAEILISTVSDELQATMKYFGYYLKKAERVTILWPPSCFIDEETQCRSGMIYLTSSFELKPRSNISCDCNQLARDGDLYSIELSESIRIKQSNTTLQITTYKDDLVITACKPKHEIATIVDVGDDQTFYKEGNDGYQLLPAGRYHLTTGTRILQCNGNYRKVIYSLPETQEETPIKKLMNVRKYYKVMKPFSEDLITDVHLSKVAEIYIEDCRKSGTINTKALEYIKAGKI